MIPIVVAVRVEDHRVPGAPERVDRLELTRMAGADHALVRLVDGVAGRYPHDEDHARAVPLVVVGLRELDAVEIESRPLDRDADVVRPPVGVVGNVDAECPVEADARVDVARTTLIPKVGFSSLMVRTPPFGCGSTACQ